MREAGIKGSEVRYHECHGTGTALGDPIEIGALKAIYTKGRDLPVLIGGVKSNAGHLEACAGLGGVCKLLGVLALEAQPANVHLHCLNPHIDDSGFPGIWPTELTDVGFNTMHCGLSSFGFGGTNSRADFWSCATKGSHRVFQQVLMDDTVYFSKLMPHATSNSEQGTRFALDAVREQFEGERADTDVSPVALD